MPARTARAPSALQGVETDLKALPVELRRTGLAASALSLARELDSSEVSATAKAACSRSLMLTLRELRALAPAEEAVDELDELAARRSARG